MTGAARRPLRIGLTGPIGCGKSTVARVLGRAGARVVDADAIARDVTATGEPSLDRVAARFGPGVLRPDGSLDRAALGRIVFADPVALADLEAIVHPAVRLRIEEILADAEAAGDTVVVIEAIKLVEGGLAATCDEVWLVTCTPAEQRARLVARGHAPDEIDRRTAAQTGLEARVRPVSTRIVDTSGRRDETARAVEASLAAALAARG